MGLELDAEYFFSSVDQESDFSSNFLAAGFGSALLSDWLDFSEEEMLSVLDKALLSVGVTEDDRSAGSRDETGVAALVGVVTLLPPSASDLDDLLEDSGITTSSSSSPIVSLELLLELEELPKEFSNFSNKTSLEPFRRVLKESCEE